MRLDWQRAVKTSIAIVKVAHGLSDDANSSISSLLAIASGSTSGEAAQSSTTSVMAAPFVRSPSTSTSSPDLSMTANDVSLTAARMATMNDLFSKFDEMSLTAARERILPSVKQADQHGQYLAICVNIQLAALVVNFIQTVGFYLFTCHLSCIISCV